MGHDNDHQSLSMLRALLQWLAGADVVRGKNQVALLMQTLARFDFLEFRHVSLRELSAELGIEESNLSVLMKDFESNGFVESKKSGRQVLRRLKLPDNATCDESPYRSPAADSAAAPTVARHVADASVKNDRQGDRQWQKPNNPRTEKRKAAEKRVAALQKLAREHQDVFARVRGDDEFGVGAAMKGVRVSTYRDRWDPLGPTEGRTRNPVSFDEPDSDDDERGELAAFEDD